MPLSQEDQQRLKSIGAWEQGIATGADVNNLDDYFEAKAATSYLTGEKEYAKRVAGRNAQGNSYKGPDPNNFNEQYQFLSGNVQGTKENQGVPNEDGKLIFPEEVVNSSHLDSVLSAAANNLLKDNYLLMVDIMQLQC